jgi:hypothetical protein
MYRFFMRLWGEVKVWEAILAEVGRAGMQEGSGETHQFNVEI